MSGKGISQMRVLLIEDEPTTAKAIELMLQTEGFNCYTTDLGEDIPRTPHRRLLWPDDMPRDSR